MAKKGTPIILWPREISASMKKFVKSCSYEDSFYDYRFSIWISFRFFRDGDFHLFAIWNVRNCFRKVFAGLTLQH